MTPEDYEYAVMEGAGLLDTVNPNWYNEINVDHLDMNNCLLCILGQLYGDYDIGLQELNIIPDECGFALSYDDYIVTVADAPLMDRLYHGLHQSWVTQINSRLEQDAGPA